jgi:hypothetical protein
LFSATNADLMPVVSYAWSASKMVTTKDINLSLEKQWVVAVIVETSKHGNKAAFVKITRVTKNKYKLTKNQ